MSRMNRNVVNLIICIGEVLIGALLLINPVGFTSAVFILLGIAFDHRWRLEDSWVFPLCAGARSRTRWSCDRSRQCASGPFLRLQMGVVYPRHSGTHSFVRRDHAGERSE